MTADPLFPREVFFRFQSQFSPLVARLTLSAKRDLLSKALWGVSHSQAMARARAAKLAPVLLDRERIAKAASDFDVDARRLLHALVYSTPTFDQLRIAAAAAIHAGGVIAFVASPGPERDSVVSALVDIITTTLGESRRLRVLHTCETPGFEPAWSDARHSPVLRKAGQAFAVELRNAIRILERFTPDVVGFVAIDNEVVAREVGTLIAVSRSALIVAEHLDLVHESMRYAGDHAKSTKSLASVVVEVRGESLLIGKLGALPERIATLYSSAPARSAGYLLAHGLRSGTSLIVSDSVIAKAALISQDEIGGLRNTASAYADIAKALESEGVDRQCASDVAQRLVDRIGVLEPQAHA